MDEQQVKQRLAEAEAHAARYEWAAALTCFDEVLGAAGPHAGAQDGRRQVLLQQEAEAEIKQLLAEAAAALEAEQYDAALQTLDRAQMLGADRRILNHHSEIFKLRDTATEGRRWRGRIAEVLDQAKELESRNELMAAVNVLDDLLHGLSAAGLGTSGHAARVERDRLSDAGDVDEQLQQIQKAFDQDNLRMACELADRLVEKHPGDQRATRKRDTVRSSWRVFEQQLKQAESAVTEGRLADARGMLGNLRQNAPKMPDWQELWLRAYLGHGQERVSQGQLAVQRHEFDIAEAIFEEATRDFGEVVSVFSEHATAAAAQTEAQKLTETARWMAQADRDYQARRWEAAREGVRNAREQLEAAVQVRRGKLGDIEAVVQNLSAQVETALEELRQARQLLGDGQSALEGHMPDVAEQHFRKGLQLLNGRDPELERKLQTGLAEAARVQREVHDLMQQAQEAGDERALALLDAALPRWPDAPDLNQRWVERLLVGARKALEAGDEEHAGDWARRVLDAARVGEDARAEAQVIVGHVSSRQQVAALLQSASRIQEELDKSKLPKAARCQELVDVLTQAYESAEGFPEQLADIQARLMQASETLARLQQAEPLTAEAHETKTRGDWTGAAALLGRAIDALGPALASRGWTQKQQEWTRLAEAVEVGLRHANEALTQAHSAYDVARMRGLPEVPWRDLDDALRTADMALRNPPPGATPLPPAWNDLSAEVEHLVVGTQILRQAWELFRSDRGEEAFAAVKEAAKNRQGDAVLAAVREWLHKETAERSQARAVVLLAKARELTGHGELDDAQALLVEARALDLESADIAGALVQLDAELTLFKKISAHYAVGQTKRASDSLAEALESYRNALQLARDRNSGLPENLRDDLGVLPTMEVELHLPEVEQKAAEIVGRVSRGVGENRVLASYLLPTLNSWFEVGKLTARIGAVGSAVALQQPIEAYRNAKLALMRAPDSERVRALVVQTRRDIHTRLLNSVQKRISRARELKELGLFAEALAEVDAIEDSFLKQVRSEMPEVIDGVQALDDELAQVPTLRNELDHLKELSELLTPLIEQVRQAYRQGDEAGFKEAERLIGEAEDIDATRTVRLAWDDLKSLQRLIERAQQRRRVERLRQSLATIQGGLTSAETAESIKAALEQAQAVQGELDELPVGEAQALRQRAAELAGRAETRLDDLDQKTAADAEARSLEGAGDLEGSLAAYRRAVRAARGHERERIEAAITRLERSVRQQQAIAAAWEGALADLVGRKYEDALRRLTEAEAKGKPVAEVASFRKAAEAGLLYNQALEVGGRDPALARRRLERAQTRLVAAQCLPADKLREDVAEALEDLKQNEAVLSRIGAGIEGAEAALRSGERDTARTLLALLAPDLSTLASDSPLHDQVQALKLTLDAADEQAKREYDTALALIEQAIELDKKLVSAQRLRAQLEEEREVERAVSTARSMAREQRFSEADARLLDAQHKYPGQPRLESARTEVKETERRRQNEALAPAEKAKSSHDYRAAVQAYGQLIQSASDQFKRELSQKQQEAVELWAEQVLTQVGDALQSEQNGASLLELRSRVREVRECQPAPSSIRGQRLQRLEDGVNLQRLRIRLADGKAALEREDPDLDLAERICEELKAEVTGVNDMSFSLEMSRFDMKIQDARWNELESRRTAALEKARATFAAAQNREGLELARKQANEVLKITGLERDPQALQLLKEIEADAERYETTIAALIEARKRLPYASAYAQVTEVLEHVDDPYEKLNGEIQSLLELAAELQRAAEIRFSEPQEALDIYERAVQKQPTLLTALQRSMNDCRTDLLRGVLDQVDEHLSKAIPNHAGAAALLTDAEQRRLVTPEMSSEVQARREKADALAIIAQAATLLEQNEPPDKALDLLQRLRTGQAVDLRAEELRGAWNAVAEMAAALAREDLAAARTYFDRFRAIPEVTDRPWVLGQVKMLEVREHYAGALAAAQAEVRTGLDQPDYELAIHAARRAVALSTPPTPEAEQLVASVQMGLEAAIERHRMAEAYDETRPLLRALADLLPGTPVAGALTHTLVEERAAKLDDALMRAEQAFASDRLPDARLHLSRAKELAGAQGDERIAPLMDRVGKRQGELAATDEALDNARTALVAEDFATAVSKVVHARRLSPKYDRVVTEMTDLRAHLEEACRASLACGDYGRGLDISRMALDLGDSPNLTQLRDEILREQKAAADREYLLATEALAIFDLQGAMAAIDAGRRAAGRDVRFDGLEEALRMAQTLGPRLREAVVSGWEYLAGRDMERAQQAFRTGQDLGSGLREPELWARYTSTLMDGHRFVEQDAFESAETCFATAAKLLRLPGDSRLSPLWGDLLRSQRRTAIYTAVQLRDAAANMAEKRRKGRALRLQGDSTNDRRAVDAAWDFFQQVRSQKEAFSALFNSQQEPPDGFDDGSAVSAARELAAQPRVAEPQAAPAVPPRAKLLAPRPETAASPQPDAAAEPQMAADVPSRAEPPKRHLEPPAPAQPEPAAEQQEAPPPSLAAYRAEPPPELQTDPDPEPETDAESESESEDTDNLDLSLFAYDAFQADGFGIAKPTGKADEPEGDKE